MNSVVWNVHNSQCLGLGEQKSQIQIDWEGVRTPVHGEQAVYHLSLCATWELD